MPATLTVRAVMVDDRLAVGVPFRAGHAAAAPVRTGATGSAALRLSHGTEVAAGSALSDRVGVVVDSSAVGDVTGATSRAAVRRAGVTSRAAVGDGVGVGNGAGVGGWAALGG
ncbi:hypothetical protein GCM10009733_016500 [Nonomuraea maheshkhaliensis]|uniref:Uncharacterized protein n=1 Tax=Nonomuraea maheshkhaliensis TaxID=419590 RepID=A0ABN2EYZ2_9ACTN